MLQNPFWLIILISPIFSSMLRNLLIYTLRIFCAASSGFPGHNIWMSLLPFMPFSHFPVYNINAISNIFRVRVNNKVISFPSLSTMRKPPKKQMHRFEKSYCFAENISSCILLTSKLLLRLALYSGATLCFLFLI